MMSRTILVTGAAGFLGSHLCDALLAAGDSVIGVDNLSTGRLANLSHLERESRFRFLGQHLVIGDQRTIYVGQKQTNITRRSHRICSEVGITGRQARCPSRASSSSAAFGPSLPES